MNKHKQFIKDAYNGKLGLDMCSEWKEAIKEAFPKLFKETELEVGKWYHYSDCLLVWNEGKSTYGFNGNNEWSNGYAFSVNMCLPASDQEVKKALIKEAKRRGIWNTPIKCLDNEFNWDYDNGFSICFHGNVLWSKYGVVFRDGKWADILLATITKEDAEKQLGKTII